MRRGFKITGYVLGALLVLILISLAYMKWGMAPELPHPSNLSALKLERQKLGDNFYKVGNCWLRKSNSGLWEEYLEGEPFERGVISGKLTKELMYSQEVAFTDQIHRLVPNNRYLGFLALFTRIFNRNLYIPEENKLEIYGESFSASDDFNYISNAFDRMLNYHAAHDIGHAMQNFAMVGCTSFAAWDLRTTDSGMLIGRNCDFSLGDKFAENKIIYFCNPKQGYKFAMVTWAGMQGCLSGMNDKGLTVTLNAAKSDFPTGSAMPIAVLAREILQYAGNIDEAYAIAKKRKTFVSETLMIGSAADHKAVLIEKSPAHIALYYSGKNYLLCTNHYQSDTFKNDKNNIDNIATSASMYRYNRLQELVDQYPQLDYKNAAIILRDQRGQKGLDIGIGNEKALNQLICHHSIIFQPEKLKFWVSTGPYQLGEFVCYDLNKVFAEAHNLDTNHEIYEADLTIPADTFLQTEAWKGFLHYRDCKAEIKKAINEKEAIENESAFEAGMINADRQYWETYFWLGCYHKSRKNNAKAIAYFRIALSKEVNDQSEVADMEKELKQLQAK
jgi:hypothetical protein